MPAKNDSPDSSDSAAHEVEISRVFDAPRALVWRAWTSPEHLAAWWGPHGCTARCEADVRPGGQYRIVMRFGTVDYPMFGVYREVVARERLVYTSDLSQHPEAWHDAIDPGRDKKKPRPSLDIVTTVTFADEGEGTRVTLRMQFPTAALRDSLVKTGMNEGWRASFEKLDVRLDGDAPAAPERELRSERLFAAPRELVWRMWTEPEHIVHWWGPNGFSLTIARMEVRPGGVWEFVMHGPDGTDYKNRNVYLEITKPVRLMFLHETGPVHRMTATFSDEGGKTRVRVRMRFGSAAELEHVNREYHADEGLEQTLNRLGERIASHQT